MELTDSLKATSGKDFTVLEYARADDASKL
jgi:hypothetical protein